MGRLLVIALLAMSVIFSTVSIRVQDKVSEDTPRMLEEHSNQQQAQLLASYALNMAIRDFVDQTAAQTFDPTSSSSYSYSQTNFDVLDGSGQVNTVTATKDANDDWTFTANVTWNDGQQSIPYTSHAKLNSTIGLHPNLRRLYDLDEGTGNTTEDLTGNGTADIVGNNWNWTTGRHDGALEVSYDYIEDQSGITSGIGNEFTVSAWIKPDLGRLIDGDAGHIIGETNSWLFSTRMFTIGWGLYSNINLRFNINHTSGAYDVEAGKQYLFSGDLIRDWFFVSASYDGPHNQISVMGEDRDGATFSNTAWAPDDWSPNGDTILMGGAEAPDWPGFWGWLLSTFIHALQSFDGAMDEIAFYDRVLTPDELQRQKEYLLPFEGGAGSFKISSWLE